MYVTRRQSFHLLVKIIYRYRKGEVLITFAALFWDVYALVDLETNPGI
jgi:hypothetical protein